MGACLTHLARGHGVAAAMQNQALNALVSLYQEERSGCVSRRPRRERREKQDASDALPSLPSRPSRDILPRARAAPRKSISFQRAVQAFPNKAGQFSNRVQAWAESFDLRAAIHPCRPCPDCSRWCKSLSGPEISPRGARPIRRPKSPPCMTMSVKSKSIALVGPFPHVKCVAARGSFQHVVAMNFQSVNDHLAQGVFILGDEHGFASGAGVSYQSAARSSPGLSGWPENKPGRSCPRSVCFPLPTSPGAGERRRKPWTIPGRCLCPAPWS